MVLKPKPSGGGTTDHGNEFHTPDFIAVTDVITDAQHGTRGSSLHTDSHTQLHKAAHVVAGGDAFAAGDLLDATAKTTIRKNTGVDVGSRRRLNLIEGTNIILTVADDSINEEVDVTINGPAGAGLSVTLISGSNGAANGSAAPSETWQILTANAVANATTTYVTVMTTTGLAVGTYHFKYIIIWQSSGTTTGVKFRVDYLGIVTRFRATRTYRTTGTAAASGISDLVAVTLTGQLVEHMSTRTDAGDLGPNTGVDTINADQYDIIEGIIVVSTSNNLVLQHASEAAVSTQVMADTQLLLRRLA